MHFIWLASFLAGTWLWSEDREGSLGNERTQSDCCQWKRETCLQRNYSNQKIVVEGFASDRDFLMFAPTGSGKSLVFHIAPFENISLHKQQKNLAIIDMIMFGWTFRWFHQKKRLSSDAGFVEYEGFWFAVKLITRSARVFSWPFDWFHGATYSPWLISFLEPTSESPWYSKCQPLIFPQGKLLSYSKTLFTMFSVLLAQFSQIIFCRSAFFIQLYANKDFQGSCELAT